MADPAAASSACPGGITPTPVGSGLQWTTSMTFTTGPAGAGMSSYSVLLRAWGGGGGGGGGNATTTGGGGGGGEYRGGTFSVTECTNYDVVVGAGGMRGGASGGGAHQGGNGDGVAGFPCGAS